ncbi:hypothetical protein Q5P01_009729 [Channa striata]|uniref:FH2 domain-containing protein n=1 Tax=Channa striata TaxID=64152 RepID=A0AA88SSJ1_CHASR|nr:hypothetical protein Q5P01_009729 [Channa striata]
MRNFNWETVPKHSVIGKHNIWTADKTDGEYELDTDHMEELFSHKQGQTQAKALHRQSLRGQPSGASGGELVSILSSKRSMNIGIFLKQFKRPIKDMVDEIKSGSSLRFGAEKLRELCKLLPDEGEVKQLLSFKGDPSALPEADLFMLMLVKIPSYEEPAGKELLESDHLHSVIRLVLKTGNYMNAGGYAGSAIGFRMSSLLKLVDTKANKPGVNLMHYVVMATQKVDMSLLNFPEHLKNIKAAARINKDDIEAEFGRQVKRIQDAKAESLKQEDLKAQMEGFLKEAEICLADLEAKLQELKSENKERETAELKRTHKDRLQSTAKRRSIATCSVSDKEMEGIALESVLQNVLTSAVPRRKSGRPFSTHGSPTRGSPTDGSLPEITLRASPPIGSRTRGGSFRIRELGRKEWNSAAELTKNSPESPSRGEGKERGPSPYRNELSGKVHSRQFTTPAKMNANISSLVRSPATVDDEGDVTDNNEEEAQKLREASKKVLRFQNSRGSVSSGEYSLESQKSPPAGTTLPRQRTVDEDTGRYLGDSTTEDLVRSMFTPQSSSNLNPGHCHNASTAKVPKTEDKEDHLWAQPAAGTHPNPVAREKAALPSEGVEHQTSRQMFDFSEASHGLKNPQGQKSSSAEGKTSASSTRVPDEVPGEQHQEGKSVEPTGNHLKKNTENTPPKSTWMKTESPGLFFSFLKRLGDISRLQNSKETVHKEPDSGV